MTHEIGRRTFLLGAISTALAGCQAALTPAPTFTPSPSSSPSPSSTPRPTDLPPSPSPTVTPTRTPPTIEGTSTQVGYTLPLTTRYAAPDYAVLYYELTAGQGQLIVWPDGQEGDYRIVESEATLVEVPDLTPGTMYHAALVVEAEEDLLRPHYGAPQTGWGDVTFTTPDATQPIRIGVIGDAGFGDSTTYALVEQMAAADLDFAIHTGDVVYRIEENPDAQAAWAEKWYAPFAPLLKTMPVYTVNGNHDYDRPARWGDSYYYFEAVPPLTPQDTTSQYYSFSLGDIQFIFLDSQVFFGQPGRSEQEAWLDERLADPAFNHTIVTYHVAAYTSGRRRDSDAVPVRQTWGPKFNASNMVLALSGHDHNYERLLIEGKTYIVSGGGSAALYGMTEEYPGSQHFAVQAHFVLLEIHSDRITSQAIAIDGSTIDEAVIPLS